MEWLSSSLRTDGFLLQFLVQQCQAGHINRHALQTAPAARLCLMSDTGTGDVSQAATKVGCCFLFFYFYDYLSFFFSATCNAADKEELTDKAVMSQPVIPAYVKAGK